ncbi:hypothetical protein ACOMHN_021644 [Nucella lapillus]
MGDREKDKLLPSPIREEEEEEDEEEQEEEEESVWISEETLLPREARIKPEPTEDIKAFAETTMNELLGWYGYAEVKDRRDTTPMTLTSCPPPSSSSSSFSGSPSVVKEKGEECRKDVSKVCDWCKHVQHGAANFIDCEDADRQLLQLCSERCLSQYKMSIFCSETQQHLGHMEEKHNKDQGSKEKSSSPITPSPNNRASKAKRAFSVAWKSEERILITPDLWLNHQPKDAFSSITKQQRSKEKKVETSSNERTGREYETRYASKAEMMATHITDRKLMSLPLPPGGFTATSCMDSLQDTLEEPGKASIKEEKRTDKGVLGRYQGHSYVTGSKDDYNGHQLQVCSADVSVISESSHPAQKPVQIGSCPPVSRSQESFKLAGAGRINTLPCSSLACLQSTEKRHDKQKFHHNGQAKCEDGRSRMKKGEGVPWSSVTSSKMFNPTKSLSCRVTSTEKVSAPFLPPPPRCPVGGVPALGSHGEFPPAVPLPPFMLGLPPFACPPGLLVPDPALMMGGYLGVQDIPPPPLLHALPPPPPPPPLLPLPQDRDDRREERHRGEEEITMSSTTAAGVNGGVPPVTLMVPFPLPLPIPVPIPLPFPVSLDKLQHLFGKQERAPSTQTASPRLPPVPSPPSPSEDDQVSSSFSPSEKGREISGWCDGDSSQLSKHPGFFRFHESRQEGGHPELPSPYLTCCTSCQPDKLRTTAAACCREDLNSEGVCSVSSALQSVQDHQAPDSFLTPTNTRLPSDSSLTVKRDCTKNESIRNEVNSPHSLSSMRNAVSPRHFLPKRSHSPIVLHASLDLSKQTRLSENRQHEEQAIDLTTSHTSLVSAASSRDLSSPISGSSPFVTKPMSITNNARSDFTKENPNGYRLDRKQHPVSRMSQIHITDSNNDPLLAQRQPFVVPQTNTPYSVRRSLILDAPSVSKTSTSSFSLERSRYMRTVPPEMVEAAKRRFLRARIRTKMTPFPR